MAACVFLVLLTLVDSCCLGVVGYMLCFSSYGCDGRR